MRNLFALAIVVALAATDGDRAPQRFRVSFRCDPRDTEDRRLNRGERRAQGNYERAL